MSIAESKSAFVKTTSVSIQLSQMFSATPAADNPTYLVLTTLDRNEYEAGAGGATGTLNGNGQSAGFSNIGGDARGAGIVFTYQPSSGEYYNTSYGDFDALTYTTSRSAGDVTDLSLFGTDNFGLANADAANAYAMAQSDPAGYLGTASVVTEPNFDGRVPAQATPNSIAAAADGFVGDAWNRDGCWVLSSTIAASAGAALPMQSSLIGLAGQPGGEWIVAFNGPAGQSGDWQAMVKAGEMVVIGTPGGGGHITTCVAGAGATATLVDNEALVNGAGQVLNPANDGSRNDIIIQAGHAAWREWAGVQASSVVIYQLDTPIATTTVASASLASHASQSLASLFSASDPAGRAITEWQVYNSAPGDALTTGGTDHTGANSCWTALTVPSLGAVALHAGGAATTDTLEVRAYNGNWWGDWQPLAVTVAAAAPPVQASPPGIAVTPTASQVWTDGDHIEFVVSPSTFTDALALPMHLAAFEVGGPAVSSWLAFNPATDEFTGIVPAAASGSIELVVFATDHLQMTAADLFSVTFAPGAEHQTTIVPEGVSGIGLRFDPPAPANMLPLHC